MSFDDSWNHWRYNEIWGLMARKHAAFLYYHAKESLERKALWERAQGIMARRNGPKRKVNEKQVALPAASVPYSNLIVDNNNVAETFRLQYGTHICPECSIPFNRDDLNSHPIQEGCCKHVKCRRCLIYNTGGCSQCLSKTFKSPAITADLNSNGCTKLTLTATHNGGIVNTRNTVHPPTDPERPTVDYGAIHALTAPIYTGTLPNHLNSGNTRSQLTYQTSQYPATQQGKTGNSLLHAQLTNGDSHLYETDSLIVSRVNSSATRKRAHETSENYIKSKTSRVSIQETHTFLNESDSSPNGPLSSSTPGRSTHRFFLQDSQRREQKKNSAIANVQFNSNVGRFRTRSSDTSRKGAPPDIPGPSPKTFPPKNGIHPNLLLGGSENSNLSTQKSYNKIPQHSPPLASNLPKPRLTYGKARSLEAKERSSTTPPSATVTSSSLNSSVGSPTTSSTFENQSNSALGLPVVDSLLDASDDDESSDDQDAGENDSNAEVSGGGKGKKKRNPVHILDHISVISGDPLQYQCNVCQKKFKTKAHIKYHEFCQKGEKPFKCEQCGQGFIAKSHYEYHLRTHTGERPYTCPKCGKGFNQRGKVTRHMRSHTGEKPFVCQQCGRGFANAQAMRSHYLIHTGERPFACEYCDKRFTGMTNLKKHVITHTGERPFMCSHCGKSFGLKWTLDLHLRTHSSERPFACDQCTRAFSNSKDLRRHMVIHSGERPFQCYMCTTSFRRKDNLDRHIKNTHHQTKERAKELANAAARQYLQENLKKQNAKAAEGDKPESMMSGNNLLAIPSTSRGISIATPSTSAAVNPKPIKTPNKPDKRTIQGKKTETTTKILPKVQPNPKSKGKASNHQTPKPSPPVTRRGKKRQAKDVQANENSPVVTETSATIYSCTFELEKSEDLEDKSMEDPISSPKEEPQLNTVIITAVVSPGFAEGSESSEDSGVDEKPEIEENHQSSSIVSCGKEVLEAGERGTLAIEKVKVEHDVDQEQPEENEALSQDEKSLCKDQDPKEKMDGQKCTEPPKVNPTAVIPKTISRHSTSTDEIPENKSSGKKSRDPSFAQTAQGENSGISYDDSGRGSFGQDATLLSDSYDISDDEVTSILDIPKENLFCFAILPEPDFNVIDQIYSLDNKSFVKPSGMPNSIFSADKESEFQSSSVLTSPKSRVDKDESHESKVHPEKDKNKSQKAPPKCPTQKEVESPETLPKPVLEKERDIYQPSKSQDEKETQADDPSTKFQTKKEFNGPKSMNHDDEGKKEHLHEASNSLDDKEVQSHETTKSVDNIEFDEEKLKESDQFSQKSVIDKDKQIHETLPKPQNNEHESSTTLQEKEDRLHQDSPKPLGNKEEKSHEETCQSLGNKEEQLLRSPDTEEGEVCDSPAEKEGELFEESPKSNLPPEREANELKAESEGENDQEVTSPRSLCDKDDQDHETFLKLNSDKPEQQASPKTLREDEKFHQAASEVLEDIAKQFQGTSPASADDKSEHSHEIPSLGDKQDIDDEDERFHDASQKEMENKEQSLEDIKSQEEKESSTKASPRLEGEKEENLHGTSPKSLEQNYEQLLETTPKSPDTEEGEVFDSLPNSPVQEEEELFEVSAKSNLHEKEGNDLKIEVEKEENKVGSPRSLAEKDDDDAFLITSPISPIEREGDFLAASPKSPIEKSEEFISLKNQTQKDERESHEISQAEIEEEEFYETSPISSVEMVDNDSYEETENSPLRLKEIELRDTDVELENENEIELRDTDVELENEKEIELSDTAVESEKEDEKEINHFYEEKLDEKEINIESENREEINHFFEEKLCESEINHESENENEVDQFYKEKLSETEIKPEYDIEIEINHLYEDKISEMSIKPEPERQQEFLESLAKSPVQDLLQDSPKSPVQDLLQDSPKSPVQDLLQDSPNSPVNGIPQISNNSPVNDMPKSSHNSPVNDMPQSSHNSPVNDMPQSSHNSPVNDMPQSSHNSPVNDMPQSSHNSPVNDIPHSSSHNSPVNDIPHSSSHNSPVHDLVEIGSFAESRDEAGITNHDLSLNSQTANVEQDLAEVCLSSHVEVAMASLKHRREEEIEIDGFTPNSHPQIPEVSEPMDYRPSNSSLEISFDPPLTANIHFVYSNPTDSEFAHPTIPGMEDSNLRIVYAAAAAQAEGSDDETGAPSQVRLLYAEALGYGGDGTGPPQFVYTATTPNQTIRSVDQDIYALRPRYISMPPGWMSSERVQAMMAEQPPTYPSRLPVRVITAGSGATFSQSFADYPENYNLVEIAGKVPNLIPQEHIDQQREFSQIFAAHGLYENTTVDSNNQLMQMDTQDYHANSAGSSSVSPTRAFDPSESRLHCLAEAATYVGPYGYSQQAIEAAKAISAVGNIARKLRENEMYNRHRNHEHESKQNHERKHK